MELCAIEVCFPRKVPSPVLQGLGDVCQSLLVLYRDRIGQTRSELCETASNHQGISNAGIFNAFRLSCAFDEHGQRCQ